jgi:hypothetical protein
VNEDEIVLTDAELNEIREQVWRELKTNPNAVQESLVEAGWVTIGVTDETFYRMS